MQNTRWSFSSGKQASWQANTAPTLLHSAGDAISAPARLEVPDHVVPVGRQHQPPGQDGETQHQAGEDGEDHRDQEINEEGDEGPESEDGGHDDDDHHVGHQPGQEELSPGQLHSDEEKDGGCEVGEGGETPDNSPGHTASTHVGTRSV